MSNLGARLKKLEESTWTLAGKLVVVQPAFGPEGTAGEVRPWEHDRNGLTLFVPIEAAEDPMGGLTDDQRHLIGEGDKVVVVAYTDDWRACP